MKCKNRGFENPSGNAKHEKCNAPLSDSIIKDRIFFYKNIPDEFKPEIIISLCAKCRYSNN